ncbi:helix-turn-helix transcriptional regulator [Streptomyces sp. NPDC051219]|uniref:helix-turn-helix domain-containing protein n=1 Tax=Streptomyces sp. NPDC051219 TaxID=3155283 RepID=UPI0034406977
MKDQTQPTEDEPRSAWDALGSPEHVVGRRVAALRVARGWSQRELATRMTDQGHSWRQTTVAKTEAADRPIRVNEMQGLARVFGVQMVDLLTVPIDDIDVANAAALLADMRTLAAAARQRVDECERTYASATAELEAAREEAARITRELQDRREEYDAAVKAAESKKAGEADGEH